MKIIKEKINVIRYNLERGFYIEISPSGHYYDVYVCSDDFSIKAKTMSMPKDLLQKSKDFDDLFKTNYANFDYKYYSELLESTQAGYSSYDE